MKNIQASVLLIGILIHLWFTSRVMHIKKIMQGINYVLAPNMVGTVLDWLLGLFWWSKWFRFIIVSVLIFFLNKTKIQTFMLIHQFFHWCPFFLFQNLIWDPNLVIKSPQLPLSRTISQSFYLSWPWDAWKHTSQLFSRILPNTDLPKHENHD